MAARIIWSGRALQDLQQIREYIAQGSEIYAKTVVRRILRGAHRLESFPLMGQRVPEWHDDRYRELIFYSYRLIYQVIGDEVEVLTIIHGARQLPFKP